MVCARWADWLVLERGDGWRASLGLPSTASASDHVRVSVEPLSVACDLEPVASELERCTIPLGVVSCASHSAGADW